MASYWLVFGLITTLSATRGPVPDTRLHWREDRVLQSCVIGAAGIAALMPTLAIGYSFVATPYWGLSLSSRVSVASPRRCGAETRICWQPGLTTPRDFGGLVLDFDSAGRLVGIDIDNASREVRLERRMITGLDDAHEEALRECDAPQRDMGRQPPNGHTYPGGPNDAHAALRSRVVLRVERDGHADGPRTRVLRFAPGNFLGMGVDGSGVVTGGESFFLLDPEGAGFDMIFEVVAHEMGHQWWGIQLKPAFAEGGGVISESLAWYSAMQLVENTKGREALRRFMRFMREPNPWPQIRTGLPLLRAMDPWANYRKGPYAMHALSEYVGEPRVNLALRTLVEKKVSSLATTLDMYRELQAVSPDTLQPLLHDLFEVNTFWTFDTKQATAVQTETGAWEVTFDVEAHKVVADSAGKEAEAPMSEWVELGVFAASEPGEVLGKPLYVQKHRIRSGRQTITVLVSQKPARGGIDPYNLLDWEEGDNIEPIKLKGSE